MKKFEIFHIPHTVRQTKKCRHKEADRQTQADRHKEKDSKTVLNQITNR